MDAARKYVEKGQTDKAIKEYLKVVNHDPKDVRVWLKIGDLYAKKGAKAEATETYLKVAKFYGEQGFYLKAVAVYKQILKLDPRMVEVNLKLAELYRQLGLLSDAMQHFERVASHFHREGKTKEALATIRQLVDLDPDNVATRIKLAELYSKEEMTEEAITEFRAACEYLRSHNRQDDFIKVAERLLWHDASDTPLNRELATLYLRRNDARRALQKLQVCFKADSRDVETLVLLAQAFQALEQKAKTVSVLKERRRRPPPWPRCRRPLQLRASPRRPVRCRSFRQPRTSRSTSRSSMASSRRRVSSPTLRWTRRASSSATMR
ncbi:MAG: tetratricopeptide repeat protein [Deltaproteobacteria bacterium]|nr:tetratricopeptide repeat protein [Deltaproteobacteria bacterium]